MTNTHFVVTEEQGQVICCIPVKSNFKASLKLALTEHFDTEIDVPDIWPEMNKKGAYPLSVKDVDNSCSIEIDIIPCWEYNVH